METKFTKSGKKVAVLGKLNNEQWIVQEIFVANGQEFPAGENFVETGLLDVPAETFLSKKVKELERQENTIKAKIENLEKEYVKIQHKLDVRKLVNRVISKYESVDLSQLETLFDFMTGQITHLIIKTYSGYEIRTLEDSIQSTDNSYGRIKLEGLRLVSLFGVTKDCERWNKDTDCRLDWRINKYRDNSGGWDSIYPCKSFDDTVEKLNYLVSGEEKATEHLIKLKSQYGLNHPTQEKIQEYLKSLIEGKQIILDSKKKDIESYEKEVAESVARGVAAGLK